MCITHLSFIIENNNEETREFLAKQCILSLNHYIYIVHTNKGLESKSGSKLPCCAYGMWLEEASISVFAGTVGKRQKYV